jgi:spore coat polysaccharide biosynthesis protein SpsF (cytidylyltransferase family)
MGSTRLPGKVLADVAGAPLLARMLERVAAAKTLTGIVVATPAGDADAPLRALVEKLGVPCFAGSEDDVLARYVGAAAMVKADPVVRLTADCPLIDPAIIDACVGCFLGGVYDYVALAGEFPDGLDTEVVSADALRRAHAEATLPSEREHVTPYVWNRPQTFRCATVPFPEARGARWTVDEPRDLEFVRGVYAQLYRPGGVFRWQEVAALCDRDATLAALNRGIERNAGYRRSLERDAEVRS